MPSDPRIRLMAKLVLLDEVSLWFIKLGTGNFAKGFDKRLFQPFAQTVPPVILADEYTRPLII